MNGALKVTTSVSPGPRSLECASTSFVPCGTYSCDASVEALSRNADWTLPEFIMRSSNTKLCPIENFGVVPTFLNVTVTFWPGATSNAVRSNFILSSALTATVFGGASGAREQLLTENARMLQANPMIESGTLILFFIW